MRNLVRLRKEILALILLTICCILMGHILNIIHFPLSFNWLAYMLLATIGLYHGTNDLYLKTKAPSISKSSFDKRLFNYLFIAVSFFLLFLVFPALWLLVFVLFSTYHFGEQHFYVDTKGFYLNSILFRFFYGLTIVGALAYFNEKEVIRILENILQINSTNFQVVFSVMFWGSLLLQAIYLIRLVTVYRIRMSDWFLFQFALFSLVLFFFASNLLWSFTFYFVFWHSIPSLLLQIRNDFNSASLNEAKIFFKRGLPIYIMTIAVLLPLVFQTKDWSVFSKWYIIAGSAIVIPHIVTIYKMLESKKTQIKSMKTYNYYTE